MNIISIDQKKFNSLNIPFLMVTANKNEKEAFNKCFRPIDGMNFYSYAGTIAYTIGVFGKYTVAHIHLSEQGSSKPEAAINTIKSALSDKRFKAIIQIGICLGIDDTRQKIGDIVISELIQPYEYLKYFDGEVIDRNNPYIPNKEFINKFLDYHFPFNNNVNVFVGAMMSGEKLFDDVEKRDEMMALFNKVKIEGGDMESAGIASAAISKDLRNFIIIKGISDFGYNKNNIVNEDSLSQQETIELNREQKNRNQYLASYNAVRYCYEILSNRSDFPNEITPNSHIKSVYEIYDIAVNPYRLFYYRNRARLTIPKLARLMHNPKLEKILRELEKGQSDGTFKKTSARIVAKLNELLKVSHDEGVEKLDTPPNIEFFYGNKGKKKMCPVDDAKIAVFDFDGTLTQNLSGRTSWELIWDCLGYEKDTCASYHRQYTSKDITHEQWCKITLDSFMKRGLTESMVKKVAKDNIVLIKGVKKVFEELHKANVMIYICSGSFNTVITSILGESLLQYVKDYSCNIFNYSIDGKISSIIGTKYDFSGKRDYIKKIAEDNDISPQEIVYFGNSNNDNWVHESQCRTVVVNPRWTDPNNRKVWNYDLQGKLDNFELVLPFILPTKFLIE